MATDLATLAIRVESLEAKTAGKRLDDMGRKGARAEKQMRGLSRTAKRLVGSLGGLLAAGAVARAFANATKVAIKFEASMSELSAITGAVGKDLEFYNREALRMGRTTTLSASQVAEGFKLIASAKPDLLESKEALAAVTQSAITLAEATGATLPDAADTLGRALNQFGAGAEEADRFINVLAAGAQKGASFVNETAEALKFAGTVASTVGVSFEGVNAAIQNLSTVGIKASEAGTALRNVYLKLEGQANERFKPSIVGQTEALKNLQAAGLSTAELVELFGLRSVVAANQLIKNADAVDELEGKLTGTNTAFEQQATKVDNLEGSLKQLGSAYEGLQLRVSDETTPAFRKLTDTLTESTNAFTDFLGTAESDDGIGVLDFALQGLIKLVFRLGVEFTDLGDLIGSWAASTGVFVEKVFLKLADLTDSIISFGKQIKAAVTFDDELAAEIQAAREQTKAANEEQKRALDERAASILREREATRENLEAEIEAFNEKVEFGKALQVVNDQEIDAKNKKKELTEAEIEALEEKKRVEAELAAIQAQAANQRSLDEVGDRFLTDIEAAEKAAAEQLAILEKLGEDSNKLTEEQEYQRLETIKRVNEELAEFKAEQFDKDAERRQKELEAELKAEQEKREAIVEFRLLASEDEAEAAQIKHEERIEQILARGKEQQVAEELINKAIEVQEDKHQKNLAKIREDAGRKQNAFDKWLADTEVKTTLEAAAQITAGVAQSNKTLFRINKIAGIANAVINTYEGVSAALALGPPQSFILAPLQLAAGLAQVSAIQNTSYEGGGGGTTPSLAGSVPTYNGQPVNSEPASFDEDRLNPPTAGINDEVSRNQVIVTGNVGWTPEIIDQVAAGLREATGERDVIIFEEGSRQAQDLIEVTNGAS